MTDKVQLFSEDIIQVKGGDILHVMKSTSNSYKGFGEAYFSLIKYRFIKGWKLHKRMTLNLVVPYGEVKFVIYENECFKEYILSNKNYSRLTIPPNIWFGFQGLSKKESIVLNIANIKHEANEVSRKKIEEFNYDWSELK